MDVMEMYERIELEDTIREFMSKLSDIEQTVIIYRFELYDNEKMTYKELATRLNLSASRVRDHYEVAFKKLKGEAMKQKKKEKI